MPVTAYNVREALTTGERQLVGTFVIVPRVEIVETAAAAGFDLVVLDLEHGPFGVESLPPLVAAAHAAGIGAIVRVARGDEPSIGAVLDVGADGVLVPHVDSGAEAARVANGSRFPPAGERSVHLWVRAAQYGADAEFLRTADERTAVIAMAEGSQAQAELEEIVATPGIDAVFVGPMDLAASLGFAHDPYAEEVIDAARDIIERTARAGRSTAIFAPTPEHAALWLRAGVGLVLLSVDTQMLRLGMATALESARAGGPALSHSSTGGHHVRLDH